MPEDKNNAKEYTEEQLKEMMRDPRYWRDLDKNYMKKITNGFNKLYPKGKTK